MYMYMYMYVYVAVYSVMSDCFQPHELQHTSLPYSSPSHIYIHTHTHTEFIKIKYD